MTLCAKTGSASSIVKKVKRTVAIYVWISKVIQSIVEHVITIAKYQNTKFVPMANVSCNAQQIEPIVQVLVLSFRPIRNTAVNAVSRAKMTRSAYLANVKPIACVAQPIAVVDV
jgi:hypothetical protein